MLVELAKTIIPDGRFRDWLKVKRSSFVCKSRLNSNDDVEILNSTGYVNMYFPKLGDVEMRFLKDDLFAYYLA